MKRLMYALALMLAATGRSPALAEDAAAAQAAAIAQATAAPSASPSPVPSPGAAAPQGTSASKPPGYVGPLGKVGRKLNDAGLYFIGYAGEFYVNNPDFGVRPGSYQFQSQLNLGVDYYFQHRKSDRTSLHFVEAIVPAITKQTATNNYFTQAGDIINASASGYVPIAYHLERFTLEQQFAGDRGLVEFGKGYVQDYVARPQCLNAFMCMSTIAITHKAAAFNFPNYSNWLARVGYNVTPDLKIQAIEYKYDTSSALTSGWELYRPTYESAGLVDAQFARPRAELPSSAELLFFYNNVPQTDQLCIRCAKTTTNWQAGTYASVMQTFWRPNVTAPKMLQAFGAVGYAFNQAQTESPTVGGLSYAVDAGLILRAPFPSRPFDSYSVQVTSVRLTNDEQTFLTNQGYGQPGPSEIAYGASANFKLSQGFFVSPYVEYLSHANAAFAANAFVNPHHLEPRDGFGLGVTLSLGIPQILGLNSRPSPYDGHYP